MSAVLDRADAYTRLLEPPERDDDVAQRGGGRGRVLIVDFATGQVLGAYPETEMPADERAGR